MSPERGTAAMLILALIVTVVGISMGFVNSSREAATIFAGSIFLMSAVLLAVIWRRGVPPGWH